ncbi:hypothetical protein OSG_eHP42_00025 [environmental Halophage eHP-42]|nr:hypothetical protein OSG_eHP42_00025 [environmental Halophage eHP-42]
MKIARDAAKYNAEPTGDVPVGQDEVYATSLSEGGAIRDDREDYDTIPFDTTIRSRRDHDEMVDHAMVDIVEGRLSM